MKSVFPAPKRALLLPILVVVLLLLVASSASAKIRTEGGGYAPFYARIEPGYVVHTDEWAAIVFYHPTDCVPDGFNLLEFFDFSAVDCAPTTDGFTIWSGEPWLSAPIQMKLQGLGAVPVWFVAWPELEAAIADGSLTLPELAAMSSLLTGTASLYNETLHPDGGAQVPMINQVASGLLEDGRSFQVHATFVTVSVMNVRIAIE